jgi:hypothetical protein
VFLFIYLFLLFLFNFFKFNNLFLSVKKHAEEAATREAATRENVNESEETSMESSDEEDHIVYDIYSPVFSTSDP